MKKILTLLVLLSLYHGTNAQNPFEQFGHKGKILTATNGRFNEFHDLDSVVQIGSIMLHVHKNIIVAYVPSDTTNYMPSPTVISRWLSPDPLSEKHYDLTPYNFVNNNPIKYIDPDGRDYGLAINHETRTVTISATYYVNKNDSKSINSATSAVASWNGGNGQYNYKVGKGDEAVQYTVNFDFKVVQVNDPKAEFMNDRTASVSAENKTTPDKSSNVYEVRPDNDKSFKGSDTHGVTTGDNYVKVKDSDAQNTTGAHEVGHTLGLGHSTSGVMTTGINDSNHSGSPNGWNVQDVIRNGVNGTPISNVTTTGTAPDNFNKGKIKSN